MSQSGVMCFRSKKGGEVITIRELIAAGRQRSHGRPGWIQVDGLRTRVLVLFDFESKKHLRHDAFVALQKSRAQERCQEYLRNGGFGSKRPLWFGAPTRFVPCS